MCDHVRPGLEEHGVVSEMAPAPTPAPGVTSLRATHGASGTRNVRAAWEVEASPRVTLCPALSPQTLLLGHRPSSY